MSKLITWRYGLLLITLIAVSVLAGRWVWAKESSVVLIAAGDIADCDSTGDEATAELVDQIPGTIATLGDNVYPVLATRQLATIAMISATGTWLSSIATARRSSAAARWVRPRSNGCAPI